MCVIYLPAVLVGISLLVSWKGAAGRGAPGRLGAPTQPDVVGGEDTESRDVFLEHRHFYSLLCELVQVAQMIMVSWGYQTSGRHFKTCDCAL